jgi:hypothetical protein
MMQGGVAPLTPPFSGAKPFPAKLIRQPSCAEPAGDALRF